jgi:hypothetical protein
MNSSNAHNTYAQLICREDDKNKKKAPYSNKEMKDFSELRRYRKGETTYEKTDIIISTLRHRDSRSDLVQRLS